MTIKDIGYLILWAVFVGLILLVSFQEKTELNLGTPVSPDTPQVVTVPTKKQIDDGTKSGATPREKGVIIERVE